MYNTVTIHTLAVSFFVFALVLCSSLQETHANRSRDVLAWWGSFAAKQTVSPAGHTTQPATLGERDVSATTASQSAASHRASVGMAPCKKLLWFTAIGAKHGHKGAVKQHSMQLRAALSSAKQSAPSVIPHLIYDGEPSSLTRWFQSQGGIVHFQESPVYAQLQKLVADGKLQDQFLLGYGNFLRLDIPAVMRQMQPMDPAIDVETRYVLYTDTNVLFKVDVDSCSFKPPVKVAVGSGPDKGTPGNGGVMIINVNALDEAYANILNYGKEGGFQQGALQSLVVGFFGKEVEVLPDNLDYKPFWGPSFDIKVLHFDYLHPGACLKCLLGLAPGVDGSFSKGNLQCACPDLSKSIWQKHVTDSGEFYTQCLLEFKSYLLQGLSDSLQNSQDRPEGNGKRAKRRRRRGGRVREDGSQQHPLAAEGNYIRGSVDGNDMADSSYDERPRRRRRGAGGSALRLIGKEAQASGPHQGGRGHRRRGGSSSYDYGSLQEGFGDSSLGRRGGWRKEGDDATAELGRSRRRGGPGAGDVY